MGRWLRKAAALSLDKLNQVASGRRLPGGGENAPRLVTAIGLLCGRFVGPAQGRSQLLQVLHGRADESVQLACDLFSLTVEPLQLVAYRLKDVGLGHDAADG
jgi:hypothetical protein